MTEELAKQIITSVLNYRREGIEDDEVLFSQLEKDYVEQEIDFEMFIELMNTGAFRASFTIAYGKYPLGNLNDDVVVKTAFKMNWIAQKGEDDYNSRFAKPKKKWWYFK